MAYLDFEVKQEGRIVSVALNHPERHNAIGDRMSQEFHDILCDYRDDPEKWVMIITGNGKTFCSGFHVDESADKTAKQGSAAGYTNFKIWTDVMQSIHKPFICAVNGACIGGGWHLVADSDIVIASERARFFDTHVHIGLVNGVESAGLMRKMPYGIVMRMVMEGKHFRIDAEQAYNWGLVSEVTSEDKLVDRAWEIARHVAEEAAPQAVAGSKRAMLGALDRGAAEGIAFAWDALSYIQESADTVEGLRAFAERRKPRFTGR